MSRRPLKTQPWPAEPWSFQIVGTQPRLFDAKGHDITQHPAAQERLIACVNGMTGIWLAETVIDEMERRIRELDELRRAALAQVEGAAA